MLPWKSVLFTLHWIFFSRYDKSYAKLLKNSATTVCQAEKWFSWWLPPDVDSQHIFFIGLTTITSHVFYVNCQLSFFSGHYECRMTDASQTLKYVVRQRSNGDIIAQTTPLITVTPIKIKVGCEVGKNVALNCVINSPYVVKFKDIPEAGKHETKQVSK